MGWDSGQGTGLQMQGIGTVMGDSKGKGVGF